MLLARARERGLDPVDMVRGRAGRGPPGVGGRRAASSSSTSTSSTPRAPSTTPTWSFRAARLAERPEVRRDLRERYRWVLRRRVPGHRPLPGRPAAGAGRRRPQPRGRRRPRPVDLRLPRRRGARHPRLPRRRSGPVDGRAARRWSRCRRPGASARALLAASRRIAADPAHDRRDPGRGVPAPSASRCRSRVRWGPAGSRSTTTTPPAPRSSTSPTCCAAPTSRTRCRGRRWRCWSAPAAPASRRCAATWSRRACRSRSAPTTPRWSPSPGRSRSSTRCRRRCTSTTTDPQDPQYVDADRAEALLLSPLGGLDAAEIRLMARALHRREKQQVLAEGGRPRSSRELVRCARARPARCSTTCRRAAAPTRCAGWPGCCAVPATSPRRARRPRRCCGRCGRAPAGPSSCARPPPPAGRERCAPTATSTRSARSSTRRPRPRSSAATPARETFLETLAAQQIPSDSLADRGVRGDAVRLHHRPPVQGPGVAAGGAPRRAGAAPGPTCAGAPPCWPRTVSAPTASCPPSRRAPCWPRSGGSSTSPAPAPASASS